MTVYAIFLANPALLAKYPTIVSRAHKTCSNLPIELIHSNGQDAINSISLALSNHSNCVVYGLDHALIDTVIQLSPMVQTMIIMHYSSDTNEVDTTKFDRIVQLEMSDVPRLIASLPHLVKSYF